jgi:hypothetical protein
MPTLFSKPSPCDPTQAGEHNGNLYPLHCALEVVVHPGIIAGACTEGIGRSNSKHRHGRDRKRRRLSRNRDSELSFELAGTEMGDAH